MASELRVNTLKDAAGSNEVAMTYVANGTAKAWVNYTTVTTTSDLNSNNVSSLTDNGTGDTTTTYVSAMNTDNYSSVGLCGEQLTTAATRIMHIGTKTASDIRMHVTTTSAADDTVENNVVIHGDLA